MRRILLFVLALPLAVSPAFGWGCEGHQMVALIARAHLTPAVSAAVDKLLGENPIDPSLNRFCKDRPGDLMADSSTWADDSKNQEKTSVWHYVDIPLALQQPASLDPFCPPIGPSVDGKNRPGCVTNAIEYESAILRDKAADAKARATALRYIIHFVGDIHQPLHGSDNDDSGGNCTAMKFFAEDKPVNLHSVWDYKLIEHQLDEKKLTQPAYAAILDRRFGAKWTEWGDAKADPVAWAWESHDLAISVTYGDLNPRIPLEKPDPQVTCAVERDKVTALKIAIDAPYFDATLPVIEQRLAQAGYRLAGFLNRAF